jgi:peptidoglycan/xylan/chitin deacetylase (PgdA/CDA1 family)
MAYRWLLILLALGGSAFMPRLLAGEVIFYRSCPTEQPVVALTFDDGPTPNLTPVVLDILKEYQMKATFFVLGPKVKQNAELLKRAVAEGHEIGNHTWRHAHLTKLSPEEVTEELNKTSQAIEDATGKKPVLCRPPFLDSDGELDGRIFHEFGMKVIACSVDSLDWRDRDAELALKNIVEKVTPGAIILCHETEPTTVKALPEILAALKAKGLRSVTVSELIAISGTKK